MFLGIAWAAGSSPLTRGKRLQSLDLTIDRRLIPAHAGKTPPGLPKVPTPRAHPRSRGENKHKGMAAFALLGSSPLTRGKRLARPPHHTQSGLIPAHAGKTEERDKLAEDAEAHPRSRGENFTPRLEQGQDLGSSPLTRGKPAAPRCQTSRRRLIPAHAGKTLLQRQ